MKNNYLLYLILTFCVLVFSGCEEDIQPIDLLPPLTTTGENTFGCLINGEAFLPDSKSRHDLNSFYQFIPGKGNNFAIIASNKISSDKIDYLTINADSLNLVESEKYVFAKYLPATDVPSRFVGYMAYARGINTEKFGTYEMSGEIEFVQFYEPAQIASGTFWFNAINEEGDTLKIRAGRFDVQFGQ